MKVVKVRFSSSVLLTQLCHESISPPMTIDDIIKRTGWSRRTIYRRMDHEGFPRPVAFDGTKKLWDQADVERWLVERESDDGRE